MRSERVQVQTATPYGEGQCAACRLPSESLSYRSGSIQPFELRIHSKSHSARKFPENKSVPLFEVRSSLLNFVVPG